MAKVKALPLVQPRGGLVAKSDICEEIKNFVRFASSSNSLIWIKTTEYVRAAVNFSSYVNCFKQDENIINNFFLWDCQMGVRDLGRINEFGKPDDQGEKTLLPTDSIHFLNEQQEGQAVMFAYDFDKFIKDPEIVRTLLNASSVFKSEMKIFCVISPNLDALPEELRRYFTIIDYKFAEKKELENAIKSIVSDLTEDDFSLEEDNLKELVKQSQSLTIVEVEKALALSYVSKQSFDPKVLKFSREQIIKQNSTLQIIDWENDSTELIGMERMKYITTKMIANGKGKGVLILGPPGTGKTQFAKYLGKQFNMPAIGLDLGKLKGELVGQTERMTRNALDTVDSVGQCILLIDEIEKGLSGMGSSKSDGGTSQNQGSTLLKWMNDRKSGAYVIATANDVSQIPPEFLRAGRFDCIFYVGLPNENTANLILKSYAKHFNIDQNQEMPDIENWTGAEIKQLCVYSDAMGISFVEASEYVNPIYKVSKETLLALQEWSKNRTINAEYEIDHVKQTAKPKKAQVSVNFNDISKKS